MEKLEKVYLFLKNQAKVPLLFEEIALILGVPEDEKEELLTILCELESTGLVRKGKKGRYEAGKWDVVSGIYTRHEEGFGFVLNDDGDVYIPAGDALSAMHGDGVLAVCGKMHRAKKHREGKIVKITNRAYTTLAGTYKGGRVFPDNRRIGAFFKALNAQKEFEGNKVVIKITDYKKLMGEVISVLGIAGTNDAQMLSIMHEYKIPEKFENAVLSEGEAVSRSIDDKGNELRRDITNLLTVTIDGVDARDLDDAISLERINNNAYRLYVHIADVSHFVKYKSALDTEALSRGVSCYLPDRVIPMLPPVLSNGVCSLNPGEKRLALTTVMDIDESGKIADYEIFESLIKSDYRLNYDDTAAMLSDENSPLWDRYKDIKEMLFDMLALSRILREKRFKGGSIEFNIPKAKVVLSEDGRVSEVKNEETGIAHEIIEEFMLSCNRTVAEYAKNLELPFSYRVHEAPAEDKVREVFRLAQNFGYKCGGKITGKKINDLLSVLKGKKGERVINTLMLRAQMKACYSEENAGHFGLGAEDYCHFTSPIRRYPDLWCHRIIKALLHSENYYKYKSDVHKVSLLASEREELAANAERDSVKYKICEYMENYIGKEFDATVSSVTSFGYFAELSFAAEGLVHITNMDDDYYIFDEKTLTLTGERYGNTISIGDSVKVILAAVDKDALRIDFVPGGR